MSKNLGLACVFALWGCSGYKLEAAAGMPAVDLVSGPPSGLAKICVVRPQSRVLAWTAAVRDNGNLVGATRGHSYFCYLAEPGAHVLRAEAEREAAEVRTQVSAGRSYYLDQFIDVDGPHMWFQQEWVDQQTAQDIARNSRSIALVGVPRREVLPRSGSVAPAQGHAGLTSRVPAHGG